MARITHVFWDWNGTLLDDAWLCLDVMNGLIEARGIGLLRATTASQAVVALAVDLGRMETERLPPRRLVSFLDLDIPLILGSNAPHFAAAVWQYLKAGRHA